MLRPQIKQVKTEQHYFFKNTNCIIFSASYTNNVAIYILLLFSAHHELNFNKSFFYQATETCTDWILQLQALLIIVLKNTS
jgi:hypothetical protein